MSDFAACQSFFFFFFSSSTLRQTNLHIREKEVAMRVLICIANKYYRVSKTRSLTIYAFNNIFIYSLLFFLLIFSRKKKEKKTKEKKEKKRNEHRHHIEENVRTCFSSLFQCPFFFFFFWWWPLPFRDQIFQMIRKNIHVFGYTKVSQARTINKYKFVNCAYYVNNIYLFFKPFLIYTLLF